MKKLIATIFASIFLFSSHSLAIDLGATIGLSTTKHLGYAEATEDQDDDRGTGIQKENGMFVDDSSGFFAEINLGDRLSVGMHWLSDDLVTPEATNLRNGNTNTLKATFEDISTAYVQIRLLGGMYAKYGHVDGTILTQENVTTSSQSGSTVPDQDLSGDTFGFGYAWTAENGFQIRAEGMVSDYDTFSMTDTSGDLYTVKDMQGVNATFAIAKAF
jgi:hypothetical protein